MPELPEAETIARDLQGRVAGRRIVGAHVTHPDVLAPRLTPAALSKRLSGRRIEAVGRRGKNVLLTLQGTLRLLVNLGMTGRLVASDARAAGGLTHVAARLELEDGGAILYDDVRRFGRIELFEAGEWPARDASLGLEPLGEGFTAGALHRLAAASRTPIRNWLLDQRRIAGVGNIYANEALFRARVHPARPASSLSPDEAGALRDALRDVLKEAIRMRGTTLRDYRDGSGEPGAFEPLLRVYGRAGEPCERCGEPIRRLVLTNRSTFFCASCQPETGGRRK